jgi:hypothetical protein
MTEQKSQAQQQDEWALRHIAGTRRSATRPISPAADVPTNSTTNQEDTP